MSALLIRREEVESWSDLAGLIPAGQQIYTAEEAHGNDETFAKRSSTKRPTVTCIPKGEQLDVPQCCGSGSASFW
jgi:hypothetical protein